MTPPARVAVADASSVPLARATAVRVAVRAGAEEDQASTVALVATELAENLHRHAGGGELHVQARPAEQGAEVLLVALDRGPGVARFERCFADGYTTTGTLGAGLGAVRRAARAVDAVSEPGRGTVVAAVVGGRRPPGPPGGVEVAATGFPVAGEEVNGDGWAAVQQGSQVAVVVADGLGHGPDAAAASAAAAAALPELAVAAGLRPAELVTRLHPVLRGTRGAAVTVVATDLDALARGGSVVSAGVGNTTVVLAERDGAVHRMVSAHGVVGSRMPSRVPEASARVGAGALVVVHTDGLTSRWDLAGRAELLRHSAVVVAAALWRDHARGSDDTAVVVVRAGRVDGPLW